MISKNLKVASWLTQYELRTRRLPHLRAARSSATLRRERRAFKWLIPALRGFPYTWPLWTGRLRPPRRILTGRCSSPAWPCNQGDEPCRGEWGESRGGWRAIASTPRRGYAGRNAARRTACGSKAHEGTCRLP